MSVAGGVNFARCAAGHLMNLAGKLVMAGRTKTHPIKQLCVSWVTLSGCRDFELANFARQGMFVTCGCAKMSMSPGSVTP